MGKAATEIWGSDGISLTEMMGELDSKNQHVDVMG